MSAIVVNRGLLRIGQQASQSTNYDVARYLRTMSIDDSAVAFASGHTALNSGGAVSNYFDQALDGVPTESSQTISHVCTIPSGSGNFQIKRVAMHDNTAGSVTDSSATLVAGVDGQSFTKTADFALKITFNITYSSV